MLEEHARLAEDKIMQERKAAAEIQVDEQRAKVNILPPVPPPPPVPPVPPVPPLPLLLPTTHS